MPSRVAVVLLAYGAAESIDELPNYLKDIIGGRPVPEKLLADVTERYSAIGGRSPLLDITREQARGLEARLCSGAQEEAKVFVGMRHSAPRIKEAVEAALATNPDVLVALPMTPYFSKLSIGKYLELFDAELGARGEGMRVVRVKSWSEEEKLIAAYAEKINEKKSDFSSSAELTLLLTAHSLPERIRAEGDSYPEELEKTAAAVAAAAGCENWTFAYQSKGGRSTDPWLGPEAGDVIRNLAKKGVKNILLSPIGFISEHMETLYDDDVLYRAVARDCGVRFSRAGAVNASDTFLEALESVVRSNIKKSGSA
jgi:ferrochelatase